MKIGEKTIKALAFGLFLTFVWTGSAFSDETACTNLKGYVEGLTDDAYGYPVTNVEVDWDGEYCQVKGWLWPETQFQVTLPEPAAWNGRYINNGGGGWDGKLARIQAPEADAEGKKYAISSANGGYMEAFWAGYATFGLQEPYFSNYYGTSFPTDDGGGYNYAEAGLEEPEGGNPYACQKVYDFGLRHLYETPVIAKKIIEYYYGGDPEFSYYYGQSCGGKEGEISAQKFYDMYDGFWINSALGGHMAVTLRGTWDTYHGAELAEKLDPDCTGRNCPTIYSVKAAMHYEAVYSKCDGVDGLVDGMIDDPRKCHFDAMTDLPACEDMGLEGDEAKYSEMCFTLAQRKALKEIYDGPHDSAGNKWYVGTPLGAEYVTASGSSGFGSAINDSRAMPMFANIALDPPEGPNFDINNFDWDNDPWRAQQSTCTKSEDGETFNIHDTLDAITMSDKPVPNMGGFEPVYAKGAKIIQQHGWSDTTSSPLGGSVNFYEQVTNIMGVKKTKSFYKLYMVPGGAHSRGGLSCWPSTETTFQVLVDWVESGIEPAAIVGSREANIDANFTDPRTRPVCPYPEVARWDGVGSIEDAGSFTCVPPIAVNIKPETINLKSRGVFTAMITVPEGYNLRDWNLDDLSCEGASAINGKLVRNKYIAKFRTQDLVDVEPGHGVELTVKGIFDPVDSQPALVQASDRVKIIPMKKQHRHSHKRGNF